MKLPLQIRQGSTFTYVLRWESLPVVYKAITGIAAQAPARITCVGHGLPDGWRAAVVSVLGMTEINAAGVPPRQSQYRQVTVVDADTVELNGVNAAAFTPYLSGGYLQYNTPVDLAGFTARMTVRDRVGGTELLSLTTENSRIALDNTAKTITLTLAATDTDDLTFVRGVYDLELVSAAGVVTPLAEGTVRVSKEITTTP
jgi:hypothetical protein